MREGGASMELNVNFNDPPGDTYIYVHFLGFTMNRLAVEG